MSPGVFAFVLVSALALANSQVIPIVHNLTAITTTTSSITSITSLGSNLRPHPESTQPGWVDLLTQTRVNNCDVRNGCTVQLIHVETSETGFEVLSTTLANPSAMASKIRIEIITTTTPSLVNIHTELAPATQQPGQATTTTPIGLPMHPGNSPAPAASQATSAPDSLLVDIVSRIGVPASSAETSSSSIESSPPSMSGTDADDHGLLLEPSPNAQFQQDTGSSPSSPSSPDPSLSQKPVPAITVGGQITLGSAVLTLTPGLSSRLGDGPTATYVAITTDNVGQTLITVSSSGTAMTATITPAPATLTQSKSDSEASITTTARQTIAKGTNPGRVSESNSNEGLASSERAGLRSWPYLGMGLFGLGLAAV